MLIEHLVLCKVLATHRGAISGWSYPQIYNHSFQNVHDLKAEASATVWDVAKCLVATCHGLLCSLYPLLLAVACLLLGQSSPFSPPKWSCWAGQIQWRCLSYLGLPNHSTSLSARKTSAKHRHRVQSEPESSPAIQISWRGEKEVFLSELIELEWGKPGADSGPSEAIGVGVESTRGRGGLFQKPLPLASLILINLFSFNCLSLKQNAEWEEKKGGWVKI